VRGLYILNLYPQLTRIAWISAEPQSLRFLVIKKKYCFFFTEKILQGQFANWRILNF
jgi:hypothetical protein